MAKRQQPRVYEVVAKPAHSRAAAAATVRGMEEARRVIERLERIDALDRATTPAAALLAEVRALLHEAEAWTRAERADTTAAEEAVTRARAALGGSGRTLVA